MFSFRNWPALVAALIILPATSSAQKLQPGPQVLSFYSDVDDTEQPYALYLPPSYDPSKPYPLVVSLHGAGSNHRLNLRRVFGKSNVEGENDVEASRYFPHWKDVDYIVASPYARGTMGYQGVAEKDVLDVLADVKRRFAIDDDRVYLTGLSMGGGGTLWLGLTRPDIWAAIAPVCPAPPPGTESLAGNALNVPVHIFQGGADPVVRPEGVHEWVDRFKSAGVQVEYTEYPGVGHDSWVKAYAEGQVFDWFGQFRRNSFPDRVSFTTAAYEVDEAYWVRLDGMTPGTPAKIDALFSETNRLEISTTGLTAFSLHPEGHPRFDVSKPLTLKIDGDSLEAAPGRSFSFQRQGGVWTQGPYEPAPKRPGIEGPMSEAVAARHIYVYGTTGDPSQEEIDRRRDEALTAATWSVDRGPFWGRVMVFPRVVSDRDVRPSDLESANLVLFGTTETNSLIAQLSERLPIHLTDSSGEHGLVYVFPNGEHYVLVSSGLPWWHRPANAPPANPFAQQVPTLMLNGRGDFLLFRGSAENVVAEGRFENDWSLSAADYDRLSSTGAVIVPRIAATTTGLPLRLRTGVLSGTRGEDSSVRVFKGIPFAEPPVGNLRWKAPKPAFDWQGVLEADTFSPGCIQNVQGSRPPWTEEFMHQGRVSEDCLYLNVWTAAQDDEKRPVLVYIHGGGFTEGSGSVEVYDGEKLARKGLVVVSVNYRLGPFGFLAHPELTAESPEHASGNYALLDQIEALRWVRDNIAAFGGDPDRVTVAGQSAGAMSVYLLTASPLAKGLFRRAIIQSGPGALASFGIASARGLARPIADAEQDGVKFGEARGAASLSELRDLSAAEIIAVPEGAQPVRFGPVVDGWFLPDNPAAIFEAGKQNDVPTISGMMADEASAFPTYGKMKPEDFEKQARERYNEHADAFLALYPAASDPDAGRSQIESLRDLGLVALQRLDSGRAETSETPSYLYYFERGIPWPEHPEFAAFHSGELPYVFGNLDLFDRPWEASDRALAELVTSYWTNFAATGDPNGAGLPRWPSFEDSGEVMVLGVESGAHRMPDQAKRTFFEEQLSGSGSR